MRTNRFATGQPTPTDNLLPVQLAFTNLPKARPQKESFGLSRRSLLTRASAGMCATKRRYRRLLAQARASGALVSSIEVAQIWWFRARGTNHICRRDLFIPPFCPFFKTPDSSCTSGLAARCHSRPSLPRRSQVTTHTPLPRGNHRRQSAMHVTDVGLIPVRPFVVLLCSVPS